MKSAVFERQQGQIDTALETLAAAIKKYPKFAKLYMIQGQIHQDRKNYAAARASYAAGIKQCPKEVTLWILASRLEEADGKSIKARALLDKARLANPGSDVLWAEAVGVEERSGGAAQAKTVLARGEITTLTFACTMLTGPPTGLQECPTSGLLWSMTIWSEPRPTRKARSADALRKAADDPLVLCTVARLFWAERKIEKARQWFERAITANPDLGDNWGWWLKFERQHGNSVSTGGSGAETLLIATKQEQQEEVIKKCVAAEPHHGPTWQSIAKDLKNTRKSTKEILELVVDALK